MKALIRNSEVYPEAQWSCFTRNHLDWMQGEGWRLVGDYVPAEDGSAAEETAEDDGYVLVNGVRMTKAEALKALGN